MITVGFVASILVGATFILAGASKLAAPESWIVQARELGSPKRLVPFVPWFELTVGASLVAGLIRPVPAVIALATLTVFTVLILLRLRAGDHPACACFGAWSARPIGPGHVVRNGILMAAALLACWA